MASQDTGFVVAAAGVSGNNAPPAQLVAFRVADEEYAVDILRVQEIIRKQELTRVPNSPEFVEGVINLRGRVIPVISLRKRFGQPSRDQDKNTRVVVFEAAGTIVGFQVDAVSQVLRLPREAIEPPPRVAKVEREFVCGVGKLEDRLLILLDVDLLLSDSEISSIRSTKQEPEAAASEPEAVSR